MTAPILPPTDANIERACHILQRGGLVAMPTETVYGLAADASDPEAVARLYAAKGRPRFNPLIAHVSSLEMAETEGVLTVKARQLADAFWPGPMTLVLDLAADGRVCDLARAGLDSLALRIPHHTVALSLLAQFGGPLVAPSANPSGRLSPTRAEHVAADLGTEVDLILDGGPSRRGLESTILDARNARLALLRVGALDISAIRNVVPKLDRPERNSNAPRSPGQLLRHYAPRARLRLNAEAAEADEAFLGFGPRYTPGSADFNLSPKGDLVEAASQLFDMLRRLDKSHDSIAVAPIPRQGLGEAINDRLERAAEAKMEPADDT